MIKTFKQECKDWLKPLGYSLHIASGVDYFIFENDLDRDSPQIVCFISGVNKSKRAEIRGAKCTMPITGDFFGRDDAGFRLANQIDFVRNFTV